MKYKLMSYGCKVNTYDSGLLEKRLNGEGFSRDEESPDVVVMNTCAVTNEATKESIRHIRKVKKQHPGVKVVMTGCAAQVDSKMLLESDADLIVANSHKTEIQTHIKSLLSGESVERLYRSNIFKKEDLEPGGGIESEHTRSFVKIQDGCNSFCTFCVIPFARGKSRSLSINAIVERMNDLSLQGVNEMVLTGVHIGDYMDESTGKKLVLEDLVEQVLLKTTVPRIRLTSLEPIELSARLLDLYKNNPRLCPHFHMSIQSATTKTLSAMKRKYTSDDVRKSLSDIKANLPNAFVGMDVIVGFPGETEDDFMDTYKTLESLPWSQIHVFPYSPRPGIYANRLEGQLHRSEIMTRAKKLRSLSHGRYKKIMKSQVGQIKELLLLKKRSVVQSGLSSDYWNISFDEPLNKNSGEIVKVKVTSWEQGGIESEPGFLSGEII